MDFKCQEQAIKNLKHIVEADRNSIVISGVSGSGKTYLVKEWAKMLNIADTVIINPIVSELKSVIDTVIDNHARTVICIENLDEGVTQASYPLLKFIEECPKYLYVAVTCNNIRNIPETILSRCILIDTAIPTKKDLELFASTVNYEAYQAIADKPIWQCVKTFSDVSQVLNLDANKLAYFESLSNLVEFKEPINSIAWKLQHYSDNSETPLPLVIRYMMQYSDNSKLSCYLECLNDLQLSRLSKNAILCKLLFDLKYTE